MEQEEIIKQLKEKEEKIQALLKEKQASLDRYDLYNDLEDILYSFDIEKLKEIIEQTSKQNNNQEYRNMIKRVSIMLNIVIKTNIKNFDQLYELRSSVKTEMKIESEKQDELDIGISEINEKIQSLKIKLQMQKEELLKNDIAKNIEIITLESLKKLKEQIKDKQRYKELLEKIMSNELDKYTNVQSIEEQNKVKPKSLDQEMSEYNLFDSEIYICTKVIEAINTYGNKQQSKQKIDFKQTIDVIINSPKEKRKNNLKEWLFCYDNELLLIDSLRYLLTKIEENNGNNNTVIIEVMDEIYSEIILKSQILEEKDLQEIDKLSKETEQYKFIFLNHPKSDNYYIEEDLEEFKDNTFKIKLNKLFLKLKTGNITGKPLTGTKIPIMELKTYKVRLVYKILDNNYILIISAFIKRNDKIKSTKERIESKENQLQCNVYELLANNSRDSKNKLLELTKPSNKHLIEKYIENFTNKNVYKEIVLPVIKLEKGSTKKC